MTKVKEIFKSIQGEGPFIGHNQLFIRFCGCNLNCNYCDTDFSSNNILGDFSALELANKVVELDLSDIHSVSLTGGEPLLSYQFLKEFLPLLSDYKIMLETNATLYNELNEIINFIDFVAADIKLESSTGVKAIFDLHEKFFNIAKSKYLFAKVVFNENITDIEIKSTCELACKFGIELILQPQMIGDKLAVSPKTIEEIFTKFLKLYQNVRLIPQVHKFINVQ